VLRIFRLRNDSKPVLGLIQEWGEGEIQKLKCVVTVPKEAFQNEVSLVSNILLPPVKVLVHGDLHCRHLMFHKKKLTGIIDWGDVGINNPAVIFSLYPSDTHKTFLNIYGRV